jgi:hypothetical protein
MVVMGGRGTKYNAQWTDWPFARNSHTSACGTLGPMRGTTTAQPLVCSVLAGQIWLANQRVHVPEHPKKIRKDSPLKWSATGKPRKSVSTLFGSFSSSPSLCAFLSRLSLFVPACWSLRCGSGSRHKLYRYRCFRSSDRRPLKGIQC